MNWVDLIILAVLAISGLLAFLRGFVHEVLHIGAWVGAAIVTWWGFPLAHPRFQTWLASFGISNVDAVNAITGAVLFLVTLIILALLCRWIGALVRASVLGGVDRSLGLLFGIARGAVLVVAAYIAAGWAIPVAQWPAPVLHARSLPLVIDGAQWAMARLPANLRPNVATPSTGATPGIDALMHSIPAGSALGTPPARQ
ncbi:MAG: CvpA family protein [Rhodospirillales bacterium]|nr:CvpA family protein [Rhodospirillales bacterium]